MLTTDFTIASLIAKYLFGDIDEREQAILDEWKNRSEHNRLLFDRLADPAEMQPSNQMAARYDAATGWNRYRQKQGERRRSVWLSRTKYAAIFLILISAGYLLYVHQNTASPSIVLNSVVSELIVPGGTKATLTLADGSAVALDEHSAYTIEETREADAATSGAAPAPSPVYHKIETPKGGEYAFTLSDGTFVRLNAMSAIHFPIDFGENPREVSLAGEAFFDVTHHEQPFIVKTAEMVIEVMGTSFNISSYMDEIYSSVTLLSGSLKIQTGHSDDSFLLTPSQQALFDRSTGEISVHQVDVSSYIAWNNGMFYFKDWTLESIMHYLGRWYDIDEVIYENERLKAIMFGCKFSKYDDIDRFLRAFEHTGKVKYHIQGKTIIFNNQFNNHEETSTFF